jgi:RimJ/RimL family protein N-acetyltransferase
MIELARHEFACALPLLSGIKQSVLPYAICEGINPGRVFVDRREMPQTALIWSPVGYYFVAGEPDRMQDSADISQTLTEIFVPASQAGGETSFILIASDDGWKEHLLRLLPGREVVEIYRRPFAFNAALFAAQGDWRERVPQSMHIQPVDAALAEQAGVLSSWASLDDFLIHGIGFSVIDGDEVASVCSSIFANHTQVEIDVHTQEKYRHRGLAMLAASALIEACLRRGKQPNWECFWDNLPSAALAEKLGFTALPDYPAYYWEETLPGGSV